jgi:tRNA threonylcarbamoyladenosine biosynthesis protein TsaE
MGSKIINLNSIEDTIKFAESFSINAQKGSCIALYGNLGVGKTLFSKALISKLVGKNINVTSPTFNIVQTYDADNGIKIYHFDLYRLKSSEEAYETGLQEALENAFCIIEWPQIIQETLPENTILIKLARLENSKDSEYKRIVEIIS